MELSSILLLASVTRVLLIPGREIAADKDSNRQGGEGTEAVAAADRS